MEEYRFGNTEVAVNEEAIEGWTAEDRAAILRRAAALVWRYAGEDPDEPEKEDRT